MLHYLIIPVLWVLSSCSGKPGKQSNGFENKKPASYQWRRILEHGPWPESYNFELFSRNDTLWVFHPDGNWYSSDGLIWKKSALKNSIHNLAFLDYLQFNDSIYGLGNFEGNIEKFTLKQEIYQTKNMKTWITSSKSNLPLRVFYHPFVFRNKIWIIGGEDREQQYDDIWNSADGVKWVRQKDKLLFGKRSQSQVVQLGANLFMLNNDVWSSQDALNWRKVSNEIVKGQTLFGYTALAFDDKIWLLGCTRNGQFTSRVLYSDNGKTWVGQDAPWSHRGGVAACVHRGKIYMTGGKFGGNDIHHPEFVYSNDLWVLEKKD